MRIIKLKAQRVQRGKGLDDVKFTKEQEEQIRDETQKRIIKANATRNRYVNGGFDGQELQDVLQDVASGHLNAAENRVLAAKIEGINRKRFKVSNETLMKQIFKAFPGIEDEIEPKVLRAVIDGKFPHSGLDDEQSLQYHQLVDLINQNQTLLSQFPEDSMIRSREEINPEEFLNTTDLNTTLGNLDKLEREDENTLADMSALLVDKSKIPISKVPMKTGIRGELGSRTNTIGRPGLTKTYPETLKRADKLYLARNKIEQMKKKLHDIAEEGNAHIIKRDQLNNKKMGLTHELFTFAGQRHPEYTDEQRQNYIISHKDAGVREAVAKINQFHNEMEEEEARLTVLQKEYNELNKELAETTAKKLEEVQVDDSLIDEFEKLMKTPKHRGSHMATPMGTPNISSILDTTQYGTPPNSPFRPAPILEFIDEEDEDGQGLLKKRGRGRPRTRIPKDPSKYNPRNPLFWTMKKRPNRQGRVVFCGGSMSLDEITKHLMLLAGNGNRHKANAQLHSLEDVLDKKTFDDLYHKINDVQ